MEAWVNRPAETRRKEVEKKNGYVARPMNSFMLYRSAYAERVKQYCKENNHQVVSQVSGASWPLEPKEVRDLYERLATTERENHQKAHPDYKFAPNKNGSAKKRKNFDTDDEISDLDDPEFTMSHSRGSSVKRNRTPRLGASDRSYQSSPFNPPRQAQHPLAQYHESSWEANNHGRSPMHVVGAPGMPGQYYQQMVNAYGPHIEDVRYHRLDGPIPEEYMGQTVGAPTPPLVGLPGGDHHDLLQSQHQQGAPVVMPSEGPLDPRLLQFDPSQYASYGGMDTMPPHYQYESGASVQPQDHQYTQSNFHPGMQTLTDGAEMWDGFEADGLPVSNDFDDQFDRWP